MDRGRAHQAAHRFGAGAPDPVMYSKSGFKAGEEMFDSFARKRNRADVTKGVPSLDVEIVPNIAPEAGEVVIEKRYPSAFFGTPLMSFLNAFGANSVLLVGFTTSGCVRATCVDAMSYNVNVGVVAEGCADRLEIAHKASLLDIHMKYAGVIGIDDAFAYCALYKIGVHHEQTHSPRGGFERGDGSPLSVGPAGGAPRLRPCPERVEGCKRGSLPRERSVAGARSTLLAQRRVSGGGCPHATRPGQHWNRSNDLVSVAEHPLCRQSHRR